MRHDPQHEIWNPFCERVDGLSPSERVESERAAAWTLYARGGGGDPKFFDYQSYIKQAERER